MLRSSRSLAALSSGFALPAALLLASIPAPLAAHEAGLSRGDYVVTSAGIRAELAFARVDVRALALQLDVDRDGALDEVEHYAAAPALQERVVEGVRVTLGEGEDECPGTLDALAFDGDDGLQIAATYLCPGPTAGRSLAIDVRGLLEHTTSGHRHIGEVTRGGGEPQLFAGRVGSYRHVVPASTSPAPGDPDPEPRPAPPEPGLAVMTYLPLGVEHILLGFDHLVFVLGLVTGALWRRPGEAPRRRLRGLVGVITAFTIGHSLSLAVVALGRWAPDPAWVEPAIALSIAYVGAENLWARLREDTLLARRWRVTLLFGLIHGLGFAGALRAVGTPPGRAELALVLFNIGVELGQLLALLPVLALAWILARAVGPRAARLLPVVDALIVLAGLAWFAARVFG